MTEAETPPRESAVMAGGCFWCTEAVFSELRGVSRVLPGYAGGTVPNPTYEEVCRGTTGHAEVVQVDFDPRVVAYRQILIAFFSTHDPTTRDRQGGDVGSQYRSAIFYADPVQEASARDVMREIGERGLYPRPLVTQLEPLRVFYPAEEYHREYFRQHPERGYCQAVIAPKMSKFRRQFGAQLKPG